MKANWICCFCEEVFEFWEADTMTKDSMTNHLYLKHKEVFHISSKLYRRGKQ